MAADIFYSLRVGLLLLFCAAWGALAVGQTDITSPAKRTAPTRHGAQKNASAQKRATDSRKMAGDEGPAALLQKRFGAAQAAEQEGDLIRAESEYRQVLGLALEELGDAYDKLGSLPEAERAFKDAAEARADSGVALLGLAVVYLRQGEFQKGVDTVRTLLSQEPMHAQARQLLGKLYFSMNRFEAAALELQEAQRLAPDDSETAITLAFTYLRQRQIEKAQKIFAAVLQQHGESPQIHIMFGAAY